MEMRKSRGSAQEIEHQKGRGAKKRREQREAAKEITQENGSSLVAEGNASPAQGVSTATSHARPEGPPPTSC